MAARGGPVAFHLYRRAAWRQIRSETGHAEARHRWRYTADMLYLLQDPGLREAYFPTGAAALAVEPAGPADQDAILAIAQAQEPARAAAAIAQWWQKAPEAFSVMRDPAGETSGFYLAAEWRSLQGRLPGGDPVIALLQRHLRESPLGREETALFLRRWLCHSAGERPLPYRPPVGSM